MSETFACPECGGEVELLGAAPGREVQCAQCATWIEVPYLPRGGVWTRARFRRSHAAWVIPTAWAGVGLLAALVAVVAWSKVSTSRSHAARDATLESLIASADLAEKAHRPDRALSEIEAALVLLRQDDAGCGDQLHELMARRDALSAREGEARIAAAAKAAPDAAVGDLLSLQARARTDHALEPLVPTILQAVEAARLRQADAALAVARRSLDEKRPLDALAAGERALAVADKLSGEPSRSIAAEAERLMGPVLGRLGVVAVQLPGKFTLGSEASYDAALGPIIVDALRRRGFAPRPASGPASALWDRHVARRLEFHVAESRGVLYLESQNRITQIITTLTLVRGTVTLWQGAVTARTQVPLPALSAHASTRIGVAGRDLDMEHKLYEDARATTLDRVASQLRGLPEP
jgi:hypothetical protein